MSLVVQGCLLNFSTLLLALLLLLVFHLADVVDEAFLGEEAILTIRL